MNAAGAAQLPNFVWVIEGLLAGMAHPSASFRTLPAVLADLSTIGISGIVSLTEQPLDERILAEHQFVYLHASIPDFRAPSLDLIDSVIEFVDQADSDERGVVIHCGAGMGRTGTLLACYLVHTGDVAEDAIDRVRHLRPGSIETPDQESVIHHFAEHRGNATR